MKLKEKPRLALLYKETDIIIPCEKGQETEIRELVNGWDVDPEKDVEIKVFNKASQPEKKRSLDANSYLWLLCGKIAAATGSKKETEYRKAIKAAGVKTTVLVLDPSVDTFIAQWGRAGIGTFAEFTRKSDKVKGCSVINVYCGSSGYSTDEMSKLIDYVVKLAGKYKIPTMTPAELEQMKSQWRQI